MLAPTLTQSLPRQLVFLQLLLAVALFVQMRLLVLLVLLAGSAFVLVGLLLTAQRALVRMLALVQLAVAFLLAVKLLARGFREALHWAALADDCVRQESGLQKAVLAASAWLRHGYRFLIAPPLPCLDKQKCARLGAALSVLQARQVGFDPALHPTGPGKVSVCESLRHGLLPTFASAPGLLGSC